MIANEAELDKIAMNLIYAMSQIPDILPVYTTIQINEPTSNFGRLIHSRLRDAGYGMQLTQNDVGLNFVRYGIVSSEDAYETRTKYKLSIGGFSAERFYDVTDGSVTPRSNIKLHGYDSQYLTSNDELFEDIDDTEYFSDNNEATDNAIVAGNTVVVDASQSTLGTSASLSEETASTTRFDFHESIKQNMYETMESNYSGLFKEFDDVDTKIIVFGNDSDFLGSANKVVIKQFIENMNHETDVLSVIGCSHGTTYTGKDNEVLAIGRASAVKLELVANGVGYGRVLDEGCWAPEHFDEQMPRRGVVLTLKRQKT